MFSFVIRSKLSTFQEFKYFYQIVLKLRSICRQFIRFYSYNISTMHLTQVCTNLRKSTLTKSEEPFARQITNITPVDIDNNTMVRISVFNYLVKVPGCCHTSVKYWVIQSADMHYKVMTDADEYGTSVCRLVYYIYISKHNQVLHLTVRFTDRVITFWI